MVSAEDLTNVLESVFPGLDPVGESEPGRSKEPSDVARKLVATTLERPEIESSSQWSHLLALIEVLLDKGAEPPWEEFASTFLEDLLNAVSHPDVPMSRQQVDERLGPASLRMADYFDRVWVSMPGDEAPNVMDEGRYASIQNPDLRWMFRCVFRRTADGAYVGLADIVRREAQTGRPGGLDHV